MNLSDRIESSPFLRQFVPLSLTVVVFAALITILHACIVIFNLIPFATPIILKIRWADVLVGGTIYLKTAIDFAIFMGRLMSTNPGWKNRIAIEIGSAAGNATGTIIVIGLWVILKDIHLLLALMVFVASLVLFELAHGSVEHFGNWESEGGIKRTLYLVIHKFLDLINKGIDPILSRVMPDIGAKLKGASGLSWKGLLFFSASVPFILGLDDFAGYVPLFNVVNVYGFAIGVIGAHTLLNISLFISPDKTIKAVKNEWVSFLGALAFIGLAFYGLYETFRIVAETFH